MKNHPHWTLQEFTTFLLLYAASIDTNISTEEEVILSKQVDQYQLAAIRKEFEGASDYENIQIILSYQSQYFADDASRKALFDKMRQLFNADGDFSAIEQGTMSLLQRIM